MLIEFKLSNFRSIREEQTLSMIAGNYSDELPQNLIPCDVPGMKNVKLLKAVALYGANASGKSSVLMALRFLADFAVFSFGDLKPGAGTGVTPFRLSNTLSDEPTSLEISVVIEGMRVLYGIQLTPERVLSEYLVAYPKGRPQVWFERQWEKETASYTLNAPSNRIGTPELFHTQRDNISLLSLARHLEHEKLSPIYNYFSAAFICVDVKSPSFSNRVDYCNPFTTSLMIEGSSERAEQLTRIMRHADLGIVDLRIEGHNIDDPGSVTDSVNLHPGTSERIKNFGFQKMKDLKMLYGYKILFTH